MYMYFHSKARIQFILVNSFMIGNMDASEVKSGTYCYICQHRNEMTDACYVCKQCLLFFCLPCSAKHLNLLSSKDHAIVELGRVIYAREIAEVSIQSIGKSKEGRGDDRVVDSDFECKEGLSAYIDAPENATVSSEAEFRVDLEGSQTIQKIFCLEDGRICIHAGIEILIYSEKYNRQFAIDCSPECAVVHTEGNTIAILDYYLNIERLCISETEAKMIDNVKLGFPPEIFTSEPPVTVMHLLKVEKEPAFSFGDGRYALIFPSFQKKTSNDKITLHPTQLGIFCTAGILLHVVCVSRTLCNVKSISLDDHKLLVTAGKTLLRINKYGGVKEEYLFDRNLIAFNAARNFCLFLKGNNPDRYGRNDWHLVVYQLGTKRNRVFTLPSQTLFSASNKKAIVYQNIFNKIIIAVGGQLSVIGLS